MKAQIEYVDRPAQITVFKHDDFFDHMRHGAKWRQQQKGCNKNHNRKRYTVKQTPHIDVLLYRLPGIRTQIPIRLAIDCHQSSDFCGL